MDGVIDMEQARSLVADRIVWPLMRDFLWNFASQVHPSRLEDLPASATVKPADFLDSPRIKRLILDSLGVAPCFHDFPKEDGSRILLLDGTTLEAIVKWLGALACAEQLRRVTDGATVRKLKAALSGVYPEVFGFTAYFRKLGSVEAERPESGEEGKNWGLEEKVVSVGCRILFGALADLPQDLIRRLALKLPASFTPPNPEPAAGDRQPATLKLILKLLKLKFPEAYSICC